MAYTREQLKHLRLAQTVGHRVGATRGEQKAAIEAMLVESSARNLSYGDRDSVGILQQRPSQGWNHASDPAGALRDFYAHARQLRGQGLRPAQLAQAVQRSAFPERYGQRAAEAKAVLKGSPSLPTGARVGPAAAATVDPSARRALLLSYVQDRDRPDALLTLAQGLQSLPTTGGLPGETTQRQPASGAPRRRGMGYPLGRHGKVIGTPYSGTHTLGNWQSDNAIDIAVPAGTRVLADEDAEVVKVKGSYSGGSDRFDGFQVTLRGKRGGTFYTHLSKVKVRPGQTVRKGDVIGRSGAANGVEHLHIGVENGDPRKRFK